MPSANFAPNYHVQQLFLRHCGRVLHWGAIRVAQGLSGKWDSENILQAHSKNGQAACDNLCCVKTRTSDGNDTSDGGISAELHPAFNHSVTHPQEPLLYHNTGWTGGVSVDDPRFESLADATAEGPGDLTSPPETPLTATPVVAAAMAGWVESCRHSISPYCLRSSWTP